MSASGVVGKALWYIESHYNEDITLEKLSTIAGVSSYHLTRSFADFCGQSVMRYLRSRRLTIAAKILAQGEKDILGLAVKTGYNSHEAFTRAFTLQFGKTPGQVRKSGSVEGLKMIEAQKMEQISIALAEPIIIQQKPLLMVGLSRQYTCETASMIPGQWQEFIPYIRRITNSKSRATFGVHFTGDGKNWDYSEGWNYMCALEVHCAADVPPKLRVLEIPEQQYAVFVHPYHVSRIRSAWYSIWNDWLPNSDYELVKAPDLECYREDFDPETGSGEIEIRIPVKPKST